jgi:hypothetical protein
MQESTRVTLHSEISFSFAGHISGAPMSNVSTYTAKLNDRDVISAFEGIATKHRDAGAALDFQDALGPLNGDEVALLKKLSGRSLLSAALRVGNFSWTLQRLRPEHNDPNSPTFDKLTFHWNQQAPPDRTLVSNVGAQLSVALSRPLATVSADKDVPELATHSQLLLAMESVAAQVLVDSTAHRNSLEQQYLEKESSLTTRLEGERERELARVLEEKSRVEKELVERKDQLDLRQNALETLQKQLDDRNNTHVRREIRGSLLQLAKDRLADFSVSKQTQTQYRMVHVASLAGVAATALAAIFYGGQIERAPEGSFPPETLLFAIKAALFATTAIALGSWYLRWLNRWLQRFADAEFKLQQFRLDIERASWLAETVLEWKSTSAEPFPELLASRLSKGLFDSTSSESEDPKSPAHHLAEAIFGAASAVKLRIGDNQVDLDRRGIKKLDD